MEKLQEFTAKIATKSWNTSPKILINDFNFPIHYSPTVKPKLAVLQVYFIFIQTLIYVCLILNSYSSLLSRLFLVTILSYNSCYYSFL